MVIELRDSLDLAAKSPSTVNQKWIMSNNFRADNFINNVILPLWKFSLKVYLKTNCSHCRWWYHVHFLVFFYLIENDVFVFLGVETDEANFSWLHPIWPPPKRSARDRMICVIIRTSTKLILCIHRVWDVRKNMHKPHWLVWQHYQDIRLPD